MTENSRALVLTDIQNDFLPGGALAVPQGDTIIPVINCLTELFEVVVATQDWHPADHISFARTHHRNVGDIIRVGDQDQRLWPVHCVQGTHGAQLSPQLNTAHIMKIICKGTDRDIDSYSTFFDNTRRNCTGLNDYLRSKNVKQVYLCGLATDYCIKYSALDAILLGYQTHVILEACRGIDANPGDIAAAIEQMERAGAGILSVQDLSWQLI